jgi:hypothetical protein
MATYISKEFTYPIPDEWCDDKFTKGHTGTWTYDGPEFLTFEVSKETGKETGWCLWTDEDLERPCALDVVRITVDCKEQPLLCEIANDAGKPEGLELRSTRVWKDYAISPDGYENTNTIDLADFEPRDVYDEFNIVYDFDTGEFNIPVKNHDTHGVPDDYTWEDFRRFRDDCLADADGVIDDGMPEELRQEWLTYRQLLRDAPEALAEFPPGLAVQMLPSNPAGKKVKGEVDPDEGKNLSS